MEDFLFGLKAGMTLEEVKSVCSDVKPYSDDRPGYYIIKPLKSNSILNTYIAVIDRRGGLFEIKASFECCYDGENEEIEEKTKLDFLYLKRELTRIYGKPLPCVKEYKFLLKDNHSMRAGWSLGSRHSDCVDFICLKANTGYRIELKVRFTGYNDSLPYKIDSSVFGFKKGMMLEEITKKCRKKPDGCSIDPKEYYPTYHTYSAHTDSVRGLYSITIEKGTFEGEDEIERQLEASFMKRRLIEILGKPSSCREFGSVRPFLEASWESDLGCIGSVYLKSDKNSVSVNFMFDKGDMLFGLRMGMTLKEVRGACGGANPEHIEKDLYQINPIKGPYSLFRKYIVAIDNKYGLYEFQAEQYAFRSSNGLDLGSASIEEEKAKEEYCVLHDILSKCYGSPTNGDNISTSGSEKETQWNDDSSLPFNLCHISLLYNGRDISLRCHFKNIGKIMQKESSFWGLRMGMTLEEVKEVCGGKEPKYLYPKSRDSIYFIKPLKCDYDLVYLAKIDSEKGLYYLKATKAVDPFFEAKSEFYSLKSKFFKKYGRPKMQDRDLRRDNNNKIIKKWPYYNRGFHSYWYSNSRRLPNGVRKISLCVEPEGLCDYDYELSIAFKSDFFDECELKTINRLFGLGKLKKGMTKNEVLSILGPEPELDPFTNYYYYTKFYSNSLYSVRKIFLDRIGGKPEVCFLKKNLIEKYGKPTIRQEIRERIEKHGEPIIRIRHGIWGQKKMKPFIWDLIFCWSSNQLPDELDSIILFVYPKTYKMGSSFLEACTFNFSIEYRFKCNAEINPLSTLKMGMTLEEVKEACEGKEPQVKWYPKDCFYINPKCHPAFNFEAKIDSEKGLYFIEESKDKSENIRQDFNLLKAMLSKKYGEPICKKKGGFFGDKNIDLKAEWLSAENCLPDSLASVSLSASCNHFDDILIKYESVNCKEIESRKNPQD